MKVLLLNATGFSQLGWVCEPRTQGVLVDSLTRAGVDVDMVNAKCAEDVEITLTRVGRNTLVWPNAYHVRTHEGRDETKWLVDILEKRGARFVGPTAAALRTVLHKDACQARLAAANVPVPRFTTVTQRSVDSVREALMAADLSFPVVVKPTSMWDSIGVAQVFDVESLAAQVGHIFDMHCPRAIIEEYLPSKDLTIGLYFRDGQPSVMAGWYEMTDRDGILEHAVRNLPWGGAKQMRLVEDPAIMRQAREILPRLAEALGIHDFTRVDGRLDARGKLRIFDVNGMPSLDYPHTVTLRLVTTVWPGMDPLVALDRLVANIVASAARRYGLEVPAGIAANALPLTQTGCEVGS